MCSQLKNFIVANPIGDRPFTAIILTLIAFTISYSAVFERFDYLHYDLGRYFTFKPAPNDIVIVAIDEKSLSRLGRWPWSRTVHADLINQLKLAQAKVIGLDLILTEPELTNPVADVVLAEAIKKSGNVVLPEMMENGDVNGVDNPLFKNAAALGRVRVPLDLDGMARSIYLWEGISGRGLSNGSLSDEYVQHFSQAVLQVAHHLPANISLSPPKNSNNQTDHALVPQTFHSQGIRKVKFWGPPSHFQHISYSEVLMGNYPNDFFKNKIVLVGATAAGLGDVLPTPASSLSQPMPGIEFHANAIAAMRSGALIRDVPAWLSGLLCAILAIVPLLFFPKLSPSKSLFFIGAYYFLITLLAVALPELTNLWLPPSGALIAVLLAYPIWSWRKLESANAYLEKALHNLQTEMASIGLDGTNLKYVTAPDEMQSKIAKVEVTSQHLSDFRQQRLDTLSFISHDIRTPLATVILQLEEDAESVSNPRRVKQMLTRALNMADEFLQSSRAEMADSNHFNEVEMVGLIQQAVDEEYHTAKAKNIMIKYQHTDHDLWVNGDYGLLQRSVFNLLSNAVKYSNEHSAVNVTLTKNSNHQLALTVADSGNGITPEKLNRLFKRFSRIEGAYQQPIGTGLGLYFVDVCIKKHGGRISVDTQLGKGTRFTIELPLLNIQTA
ncbi:MAG: CHASE2 domain-containing protein [Methylophilaceae bacterium]